LTEEQKLFQDELELAVDDLTVTLLMSLIYLLIPVQYAIEAYFYAKTQRVPPKFGLRHCIDWALFVLVVSFAVVYYTFSVEDTENKFIMEEFDFSPKQHLMINIMLKIHENEIRFDFLLACLVGLIWMKLIFYFKGLKQFGPMFKIITCMIFDLLKFLSVWLIIQLMFSCMSMLIFGQLSAF
jgi:hypothetical protein